MEAGSGTVASCTEAEDDFGVRMRDASDGSSSDDSDVPPAQQLQRGKAPKGEPTAQVTVKAAGGSSGQDNVNGKAARRRSDGDIGKPAAKKAKVGCLCVYATRCGIARFALRSSAVHFQDLCARPTLFNAELREVYDAGRRGGSWQARQLWCA